MLKSIFDNSKIRKIPIEKIKFWFIYEFFDFDSLFWGYVSGLVWVILVLLLTLKAFEIIK